jgi:hypothetical protein
MLVRILGRLIFLNLALRHLHLHSFFALRTIFFIHPSSFSSHACQIILCSPSYDNRNLTQPSPPMPSLRQSSNLFSLSALLITDTELKVMATLAITGLSSTPKKG